MGNNLKRNFIYSLILTASGYLFPLITYPYVSRVLGVNGIGICNYIESIISYFYLFSFMGTLFLGIREIAEAKKNNDQLNAAFSSIILINIIATVICTGILLYLIFFVQEFVSYKKILCIGILRLWGLVFSIDWFYKGLEEFKYITERTIIVKLLYVILIFVFIRNEDDYITYFLLSTLMYALNSIINCIYSRKYIKITFVDLRIKKYLKPYFVLGLQAILTSMYTSFNVAFLGYVTSTTEVGYYTTATKLFGLLLSIFSALTGVMIPKMSSLVAEGKISDFKILLCKSIDGLMSVSIPLILFTIIFSPDIVVLLSGDGYEGAFLPSRIIMPLIFIIGYEQILVLQTMVPLKDDKNMFVNSIIGAMVGVILNLLIVQYYGACGSAIVWLLSEITVLICAQYFVYKKIQVGFPMKNLIKHLLCYIPLCVILLIIYFGINCIAIIRLVTSGGIMISYFLLIQRYVIKNQLILNVIVKKNRNERKTIKY